MYAFNAHGGKYDHDKQIGIGSDAVGEGEYVQKLFPEKQAQEAGNHTCRYEELLEEMKSIGEKAFYGCDVLEAVIYQGEKPEIGENAFPNCPLLSVEEEDEIIAGGTCGEKMTWSRSKEGKLTIDGEGDMDDYTYTENGDQLAP